MKENFAKASYQKPLKTLLHVKRKFIKSLIFSCQPLSFLYNLPCPVCCVRHTRAGDHPRVTLHQCWASSDPASHWSMTPNTGLWLADCPTLWRISIFGNISRHSGEQIVSNKWFCAMFLFCQTPHCLELSCNQSVDQSEASIGTNWPMRGGQSFKERWEGCVEIYVR